MHKKKEKMGKSKIGKMAKPHITIYTCTRSLNNEKNNYEEIESDFCKKEHGSITVVVLATVTFILIILATIFTTITIKRKSQQIELQDLKTAYDAEMAEIYEERINRLNSPVLKNGMKKIMFRESLNCQPGEVITENDNRFMLNGWYDYNNQRWANTQTEDGSMWVWIPRYAYKITYYTDETKTVKSTIKTLYGDIDIKFLAGTTDTYYDEDAKEIRTAQRCESENQVVNTNLETNGGVYTVHPAFTNESSIHFIRQFIHFQEQER